MKNGVSLVVLIITIIIMSILAGIAVANMNPIITNTEIDRLQMDIAQIESLMNTYRARKNGIINFDIVELDIASLSNEELRQFSGETITDNKVQLLVVDLLEIDADEVNFGNLKLGPRDRYLYSNTTGKVYYEYGLEVGDIRYYYVENGEG